MPPAKADWSSKWLTKKTPRRSTQLRLPKRGCRGAGAGRGCRLRPRQPLPAEKPAPAEAAGSGRGSGSAKLRPPPRASARAAARAAAVAAAVAADVTIVAAAVAAATTAGRPWRRDDGGEELIEKLVHINRVSKTVKGGKRFGFAALVVVGDGKGRAGFGHGKAREVPEAISKATAAAKKAMVRVPLRDGRTLHHDGKGHFGAGKVTVRSAPSGTGIIAGGPMRAVFESLGVADVVTKSVGTSNPYNMIRATFEALKDQTSPRSVAQRRGKKVSDLLGRGGMGAAEAEATAEAVTE